MSIVWKLYEQYSHPLARILQGVPISWDPSIATIKCSGAIYKAVWSPCSRFIAILFGNDFAYEIQVLDAVTLKQLKTFIPPYRAIQSLTFSPENRFLTLLSSGSEALINWDLQTGILVSKITMEKGDYNNHYCSSLTYSECGTMFGVLSMHSEGSTINTYDVLSSMPIYHHSIEGLVIDMIWTQGEHLQFATLGAESITTWEVGFSSRLPPTEVKSLSTLKNFNPSKEFLFLPSLSWLAFIHENTILVWDAQHSRLLLDSIDVQTPRCLTFSSDGHFFACRGAYGQEIHLWKVSPTGYTLHQKLMPSSSGFLQPLLSPNGQLIIMSSGSTLQLWHTTDSTSSPSSLSTHTLKSTEHFILEFSPDRSLAATALFRDNTVTVIDLRSGVLRLTIDTSMEVYCLGITQSTIIIVGNGKIITWNLPIGEHVLSTRVNIDNSIQTTMFGNPAPLKLLWMNIFGHSTHLELQLTFSASIFPSFNYVVVMGKAVEGNMGLIIYDTSTGEHLVDTSVSLASHPLWFTPDGCEVWCGTPEVHEGWAIIKDSKSSITRLEGLDSARGPVGGFLCESSQGYQVTDDGWIFGPDRKQLLWLPHHWRLDKRDRMWHGQFLGLLHCDLSEVVILEVPEE